MMLCGFAILTRKWVASPDVTRLRSIFSEILLRTVHVAALFLCITVFTMKGWGLSWETLDPESTLLVMLVISGAGVAFQALHTRLLNVDTARSVVVFGDGTAALTLARRVKVEM